MSGIIDTTLPQLANQVRTATVANENDRERVGSLFEGIIDYIAQNEAAWLQDTGGEGGGSLSEPGALLKKLWLKGNPEAERILKYDGSDWVPIPVPSGGGSGGGMDVAAMWTALQSTTGDYANTKIPANHLDLTSCLKTNTTFWGNTANTTSNPNAVTGSLSGGIQFVEFSNNVKIGIDPNNPDTIRIYKDNNDSAHFYATGGVSALGYSSSGGGGGGGDTPLNLNAILASINGSNNTVPTFDSALKYTVLRTNQGWQVLENTLGRLSNVQLNNNLADGQALVYNSNGYWENRTVSSGGGAQTLNELDGVANTFNNISSGQVLTYSNGEWKNTDLPVAQPSVLGVVMPGTGLSASSGTLSVNTGFSESDKNYAVKVYSGTGTNAGKLYVTVPWTDNDHTYEGGAGITVGSSPSQSGNYPISVVLTDGGGLAFDNNGKLKISNTYGGTKYLFGNPYWQNGLPQSYGYDNSHLTDINYVTNIYLQSSSTAAATALTMRDPGATNDTNSFVIRKNSTYAEIYNRKSAEPLLVTPGSYMAVGQGNIPSTTIANYINGCMLWSNGSLVVGTSVTDTTSSITLGGAVLKWDETNKALYVQRKDGSAANFYATGGVSALGMSPGISSIDAMTFGVVDITSSLKIKLGNTNNKATIYTNTGTGLIIDNPYGGIFINDSATYINDAAGDTYFGGDENTDGGNIYICLASQGYEYYRLDVDKLQRDGYLTLD